MYDPPNQLTMTLVIRKSDVAHFKNESLGYATTIFGA